MTVIAPETEADPTFFTTMLKELTRLPPVPPEAEIDVTWITVLWEFPFTSPYTELVTIPPTARTAPMMMKRSRDWDMPECFLQMFIDEEGSAPI